MDQARATSNRQQLRELLGNLPMLLSGRSNPIGAGERVRTAALKAGAVELLSIIQEAFIAKARGGTDEAGISWKPLDRKTVAYGRRHPGLASARGAAKGKGRASRPLLTDAQDSVWRAVYAQSLRRLGSAEAAAAAWAVVKGMGGKTILAEYGGVTVEIGRDTGRLLNSLTAGTPDSLMEILRNSVVVGTNVEYAGYFHAKRPLWPDRLPDVWQERVAQAMATGLMQALAQEMRG